MRSTPRLTSAARLLAPLLGIALAATAASARQHRPGDRLVAGAHAVGLVTRADPVPGDGALTEAYVVHPVLHARYEVWPGPAPAAHGSAQPGDATPPAIALSIGAMLNFEALTLERGELAAGNAGEGYIDRRHPHTLLHEAVAVGEASWRGWRASLAAGRGFAPFGTDDPMVRPFTKYPANHHLAQILERWIVVGAVARGPVTVEVGLFNGDEPTDPYDLGRLDRFADSWSARVTLRPAAWAELQAGHARVESPEHRDGGGLDQRKWSASARVHASIDAARRVYLLIEWARSQEGRLDEVAFEFDSWLGEATLALGGWTAAARVERTTRPEEERLANPFRTIRPHADDNVIGVTRWVTTSLRAERAWAVSSLVIEPFTEVSYSAVKELTGSIFDPVAFYGSDRLWTVSAGVRVGAGHVHTRMGRYGAALPARSTMH